MKSRLLRMCTLLLVVLIGFSLNHAFAAPASDGKKAILVVSNGSSQSEVLNKNIESVEKSIQEAFPDYDVRRAFTSPSRIEQLMEHDGVKVDNEIEALERLKTEGYSQVVVQPLYITIGEDYSKVKDAVQYYQNIKAFGNIVLGRPLLYYTGEEGKPDDYLGAVFMVKAPFPKLACCNAIILVGHDGAHPDNRAYTTLQKKIDDAGFGNIYVCTLEGKPSLGNVLEKINGKKFKKITIVPFTLLTGEESVNTDLSSSDIESVRNKLVGAGFKVETYDHGLGENFDVQQIYVQHVQDAIRMLNGADSQ